LHQVSPQTGGQSPAQVFSKLSRRRLGRTRQLHAEVGGIVTVCIVCRTFQPEGRRAAKVNLLLLASAFQQPFGVFSGTLETEEGKHDISQGYGFVEEHFARW
jgi:hypothetical protein